MTTLVNKDLVQERGRPLRKYALTEDGWEVARRIRAVQGTGGMTRNTEEFGDATDCGSSKMPSGISLGGGGNDRFVDLETEYGQEEPSTQEPMIPSLMKSPKQVSDAISKPAGERLGGAVVDMFATFSKSQEPKVAQKQNFVELLSSPEPEAGPNVLRAPSSPNQNSRLFAHKTSKEPDRQASPASRPSMKDQPPPKATVENTYPPDEYSLFPTFEPVRLAPGTFTVHLVLDNREVRAKDDRDYISDELSKRGATPLVRPLELGDFFWVAKCHDPNLLSRYGEEGSEVCLDWIVERKRLDDLVGSITDGRFQEQKFRLGKSGVKNVIYLIEEFSLSTERTTRFHEAIQSAIASTQVVNGYFVKKTQKLDDTIRYLARMTRMLKTLYESKPLYLIPTKVLTPSTYLPLLLHLRSRPDHAGRDYTITYPSFASLSSKSDTLTLRDVFLKMLMCTRGISGDKALAIQKVWGTPRTFVDAFERCTGQKERETLVERELGGIVGRAKIKRVLSAKVAGVWGEE